ncbi:hypothetical protein MUK42_32737 [Musa troglodytarum]|uniref:Uncharacterized protein n=1 Tax=Musa troglodytarum TaxID=320322 RepID=A0A9E7FAL6_9LILI|nr:hypothetical protein MUK42_32737 [Musa troglodytarum]
MWRSIAALTLRRPNSSQPGDQSMSLPRARKHTSRMFKWREAQNARHGMLPSQASKHVLESISACSGDLILHSDAPFLTGRTEELVVLLLQ